MYFSQSTKKRNCRRQQREAKGKLWKPNELKTEEMKWYPKESIQSKCNWIKGRIAAGMNLKSQESNYIAEGKKGQLKKRKDN